MPTGARLTRARHAHGTHTARAWHAHGMRSRAPQSCEVPCWQALVGGRYALLARRLDGPRDGPLQPRPDFWVALLWRRLMGTRVLAVHLLVQPDTSLPSQASSKSVVKRVRVVRQW